MTVIQSKKVNGKHKILLLSVIMVLLSFCVFAQKKWSFELRPAIHFPTKDLGTTSLKTGAGISGQIAYKFMPHLAAYGGWSWSRFTGKYAAETNKLDFEETGYCFGLQFIHPVTSSGLIYMLKAGATVNHIETENNSGQVINDTGHGLGWELGAGIGLRVSNRIMILPQVNYRSLSRDIKYGSVSTAVDLNYISAGVGVSFSY